jgi:adenylosuccinate synthase
MDGLQEAELGGDMIGIAKRGIGPCYASKAIRNGLCVDDLHHMDTLRSKLAILFKGAANQFKDFEYNDSVLDPEVENYKKFAKRLEPYIADTVQYISNAYTVGKCILNEGGQATMLDVDFGTYLFVTPSNPSVGGICTGLGVSPKRLGDIIGVVCLLCFLVMFFARESPCCCVNLWNQQMF